MRKPTVILTVITLVLCTLLPASIAKAATNPFTGSGYSFYVWDDLSGKADKTLVIPASGSNEDIYYYSGNGQTIYKYQNEKLRIAQASDWQMVMLTTGRQANRLVTRNTEGFGFYINNQSGSSIVLNPIMVGEDFFVMKNSSTAYLFDKYGNSSAVQSLSFTGGVEIPNGFEGYIAVPFENMYPTWGYVSSFVPGASSINFFTVQVYSTFNQGANYIEIDNMFVYGVGATPYKEYLVKGGSSYIPLDATFENPFANQNSEYFIWESLDNMPDMSIPLPADGQQNNYVLTLYGSGSHEYKYVNQQLHVVGAYDWKLIQLNTGHHATAAQTSNAKGLGFYVKNSSGKSITVQPYFIGDALYYLKAAAKALMVDMDGWSNEEATADWGGVLEIPQGFEGYVLTDVSALEKVGGGSFVPGTSSLYSLSVNLYANFPNDGERFVAFDNMFIYGENLNTTTPDALEMLFPEETVSTIINTQPVAAPIAGGYNGNDLVGVDQFGRSFGAITGTKTGKDVGMFFWLWMGQPTSTGIYDMTEFMKTPAGRIELFDPNSTIAPADKPFFWGEPLFGYYNSTDEYVLRKQIEMLTLAGIDFLVFDTTNAVTYPNVYRKLFKLMDEYQGEGWNVPKIAFYTHSRSIETTKKLYKDVYKANLYPNLWYYYKGKPMIISYTDITDDYAEAITRDDNTYKTSEMPTEILNFFSFKYPQWPNEGVNHYNGFPYVEWEYPLPVHNDVMNVSAASQHWACMSNAYTHPYTTLPWGRGFDFNTNSNISANSDKGTYFQAQWNDAFRQDPDIVFIDGWNEWIGYKVNYGGQIVFVDAFTKEFSRDIEPMKGGHEDAFYLQTIKNIRQYNGLAGKNYLDAGKTVDISGPVNQWDSGVKVYRAFGEANYGRDAYDYAGINKYTQAAPRNNIQEIRVVNDANYIYFYIMCEDNITAYDGSNNWMNLLLGTGSPSLGGWNGYDFVVNRSVNMQTGKTDIVALNSDFTGAKVGEGDIVLNGRIMTIRIARAALGLSYGQAAGAEFYFKVADGVTNPENIENYYISGKSIPMGRLSYSYAGVKPAIGINPITDTSIGIKVYEDFSARPDMQLPLADQNDYFWVAPNAANYSMSFSKQRALITKAPANDIVHFLMYLSSSTYGMDLTGLQGAGLYIKNNTGDRMLISPYYIGDHSFYIPKGSGAVAKLINLGGDMTLLYDTGELPHHACYSIPAGFEGYITFESSSFECNWHGGGTCSFTPWNFSVGYFSLVLSFKGGCNNPTGESAIFDNLFFYGSGMTPYKQHLVRP